MADQGHPSAGSELVPSLHSGQALNGEKEQALGDYTFDQYGALRHKNCGGQIAVEAELYVISGFGFPRPDELKGCRVEQGPHGIVIARKFGGYRGYCMKCEREGKFYGRRYRPRHRKRA
jgi:hypothetical protein